MAHTNEDIHVVQEIIYNIMSYFKFFVMFVICKGFLLVFPCLTVGEVVDSSHGTAVSTTAVVRGHPSKQGTISEPVGTCHTGS